MRCSPAGRSYFRTVYTLILSLTRDVSKRVFRLLECKIFRLHLELFIFANNVYLRLDFFTRKNGAILQKKTGRATIDENAVASAIADVLEGRLSIRKAADKYNLKTATLQHRIEKQKKKVVNGVEPGSFSSKYTSQQVFNRTQEEQLNEYIIKCSKMHYGLTLTQVRELAYQFAKQLRSQYPSSWDDNKIAGVDWISGFRKRNNNIRLRKPENTSVARSFGFNKTAVNIFFNNLEEVLSRYNFTADRIVNFDETGVKTVLNTPKVLAAKSQRQVGQIVSAERGELVTFGGIITGIGNALPPVFVFPRVHYKTHFLTGAPEGSLGMSSRSGWINGELFLEVLVHIQKHTNSTKERPILLLCDNHESHISIEAINYSRDNGIVYLSFPPHTSHKLQPLDVGVFGPFKAKLKVAFNDWHVNHPGNALSIYDIPGVAKLAYLQSFTVKNISSGFSKPGIVPFNKLAFSDEDFAPCEIYRNQETQNTTESPPTHQSTTCEDVNIHDQVRKTPPRTDVSEALEILVTEPVPSGSKSLESASSTSKPPEGMPSTSKICITPEAIRPYPEKKASTSKKGKEKGKSRIYTDTPEKQRVAEKQSKKVQKKQIQEQRKRARHLKTAHNLLELGKNTIKKPKKMKMSQITVSEFDCSSSSTEKQSNDNSSDDKAIESTPPKAADLKTGDFVIVKLEKKKTVKHFVGKIISKYDLDEFQVSYLRRKLSANFVYPDIKDEASVHISDIVLQLPMPVENKGTSRMASRFKFKINLSPYNL